MKNIEKIKKKYIRFFATKYYKKEEQELTKLESYRCSSLGEIWAYLYSVIPEDYGKYTIFDFDGRITGSAGKDQYNALSEDIVLSAKNKICSYCWGISWEDINEQKLKNNDNIMAFLRKKSVMMRRFQNGNNIIIFGSSESPIGRTMLASIVMKEAIKLRITHSDRSQTYDWIDFSQLFKAITTDSNDLVDYKCCDWLVVDNITKQIRSGKQTTLLIDSVDSFFLDRYNSKLPTILVFKSDIRDKSFSMAKSFGGGLNRIFESKRTCKIPLSDSYD